MLSKLLPNPAALGTLAPYSTAQHVVEACRCVLLHRLCHVRVEIQRLGDGAVAQALLRHLRMDAGLQQLSRVRVPQIVKADLRKVLVPADQTREFMRQAAGL
jgi:hypothetical protein